MIFFSNYLPLNKKNSIRKWKNPKIQEFINISIYLNSFSNFSSFNFQSISNLKGSNKDKVYYGVLNLTFISNENKEFQFKSLSLKWFTYSNFIRKEHFLYQNFENYDKKDHFILFQFFFLKLKETFPDNRFIYIYIHNWNSIESWLLFENFLNWNSKELKILWNKKKEWIEIQFQNIKIRNSYLIFPLELNKKEIENFNFIDSKDLKEKLELHLTSYWKILLYYQNYLLIHYKLPLWKIYTSANMSFQIYRINFQFQSIPNLSLSLYSQLKSSYFGGYFLFSPNFRKNIYHYDVNSLYPYVMLNPLPGKYLGYKSSLTLTEFLEKDLFGFFYCHIENTSNKKIPLWPFHQNEIEKNSQISSFQGLFFSEEIKNWIQQGYTIQLKEGFIFSRLTGIFQEYIHHFYQLKQNENHSLQFLAKTLLNNFSGYWGRSPFKIYQKIIHETELKNYLIYFEILDLIELKNSYYSIRYSFNLNPNLKSKDYLNIPFQKELYSNSLSHIGIASAITSYGRIFMNQFFNLNFNIYYCDCDSLFIDKPLNSNWIGPNLGQFKLINSIQEAYFLAPKFYAYKNDKNQYWIKSGGLPTNSIQYQDFQKIYQGQSYSFHYTTWIQNWNNLKLIPFENKFNFKMKKK